MAIMASQPSAALATRSVSAGKCLSWSSGRIGDVMGHGPATFKETDLTRALRAARKAGADVMRVEVGRDGRIVLVLKVATTCSPSTTSGTRSMARIRLKYINAFANCKRRNKQVRYYFRRRGFKAIPLPGPSGFGRVHGRLCRVTRGSSEPGSPRSALIERNRARSVPLSSPTTDRMRGTTASGKRRARTAAASSSDFAPSTAASACGSSSREHIVENAR